MHVALRPALLLWATALRPLPLHPLMTADSVPPVRAAAPIVSSPPKTGGSQLVPKVDEELLAQVKQDIWRTSGGDGDSEALVREQIEAVDAVLAKVEVLVSALAASSPDAPAEGAGAAQLAQLLPAESLDAVIAPQLPLLMMRGYPDAARSALSKVRTVGQQAALLSLTQYMVRHNPSPSPSPSPSPAHPNPNLNPADRGAPSPSLSHPQPLSLSASPRVARTACLLLSLRKSAILTKSPSSPASGSFMAWVGYGVSVRVIGLVHGVGRGMAWVEFG